MSLNYELSHIKDYKTICHLDGETKRITTAIIFSGLSTDVGALNKKTLPIAWSRYVIWCRINEFDLEFSYKDMENHLGLYTNVVFIKSDNTWMKRVVGNKLQRIRSEYHEN